MKRNRKSREGSKQVGEGAYRRVFRAGFGRLGKVLKSTRPKNYSLFSIRYPMRWYTRLKFGVRDLNQFEYDNYRRLMDRVPRELERNFAKLVEPRTRKKDKQSVLIVEEVKNFDGEPSKNLLEIGPVSNEGFWRNLTQIENFFLQNKIPFFNIRPENIMVKWVNSQECIPVFIDFKRIGARTYLFQPSLRKESGANKKIRKRFARIRQEFKA